MRGNWMKKTKLFFITLSILIIITLIYSAR
ncbi:Uncharacterised protein [Turicibacter sanguinis]|nr:Uncharacterised protein [Turicibacter sanguinis]